MKKGAPRSDVKTPTSSSAGARTVLAIRSASTIRLTPLTMLSINKRLCSGPQSSLVMCGTSSPTNGIAPATLTAEPTRSAIAMIVSRLSLLILILSEEAISSPRAKRS